MTEPTVEEVREALDLWDTYNLRSLRWVVRSGANTLIRRADNGNG